MSYRSLDIDLVACKMLALYVLHRIVDSFAQNAYIQCTLETFDHVTLILFTNFVLIEA